MSGSNFLAESASEKTASCTLTGKDDSVGTDASVKFTVSRQEVTRVTNRMSSEFDCIKNTKCDDTDDNEWSIAWIKNEFGIKIDYTGRNTAVFKCSVLVDDVSIADSLVFIEALCK